tara:strand:+ start:24 stop:227 length:204 start_codon:yes stop_codon:yes gene_type:complete
MKVNIKLYNGETKVISDIRNRIENCTETIIDNLNIVEDVYNEFGHDLRWEDAEKLSNIIWKQLKHKL